MPKDDLPKLKKFTVRTVQVPLSEPHRTASGVIIESPLVLLDITLDTGLVGHSIVFAYTPAALKPTAELIRNMEALVIDEDLVPEQIEKKLAQRFRLLGTQGLVGMALAGIDMALWDALARTHRQPLTELLGATIKPVRAYAAIGYDGETGSAQTAEAWAKLGYQGIKAKIGYPTVGQDLAVVRAMRKAAGDEMSIMVDYNQSLTPQQAVERLRVLDQEGLTWVEEPTIAHDYVGHARIASESQTPIQCGENWWGILDMCHAIDAESVDLVMPDVMKIGGVTGWLKAAEIAESKGLKMSNHLWPELSARLLCDTPTAHWLEYVDWWNPIVNEPLQIDKGMALIDAGIGSGITWNESAVQRFTV